KEPPGFGAGRGPLNGDDPNGDEGLLPIGVVGLASTAGTLVIDSSGLTPKGLVGFPPLLPSGVAGLASSPVSSPKLSLGLFSIGLARPHADDGFAPSGLEPAGLDAPNGDDGRLPIGVAGFTSGASSSRSSSSISSAALFSAGLGPPNGDDGFAPNGLEP